MKKLFLLILVLSVHLSHAQRPDSVQINGSFYYIYPYPQIALVSEVLESALNPSIEAEKKMLLTNNPDGFKMKQLSKKERKLVRKNSDAFYDTGYDWSTDIVPPLDPLPDGKYVQYFEGYFKFDKRNKLIFDNQKVAGFFDLKNNLPHGRAMWLNPVGDTVKSGEFVNGLKEGIWTNATNAIYLKDEFTFYPLNVKQYLVRKTPYEKNTYLFHKGLREGPYTKTQRDVILEKGNFQAGEKSGEWFEYQIQFPDTETYPSEEDLKKVLLQRHYTLAEDCKTSQKVYIRTITDQNPPRFYSRSGTPHINFYDFWCIAFEKEWAVEEFADPRRSLNMRLRSVSAAQVMMTPLPIQNQTVKVNNQIFTVQQLIDSLGIYNKYDGIYEEFHDNGKLKIRLHFENGDLLEEDTIFWDNGVPADVVIYHSARKEYENRKMDSKGEIYEVKMYDEKGNFLRQEMEPEEKSQKYLIEGFETTLTQAYNQNIGFEFENEEAKESGVQPGKTIIRKSWYIDTSIRSKTIFDADTRTLNIYTNSVIGTQKKSETLRFDETYNSFEGQANNKIGNISSITLRSGKIKPDYKSKDNIVQTRAFTKALYAFDVTQDVSLHYQDKPFTGSVTLKVKQRESYFSFQPDKMEISISDPYYLKKIIPKDLKKFRKTGKTKYPEILSAVEANIEIRPEDYFGFLSDLQTDKTYDIFGNVIGNDLSYSSEDYTYQGNMLDGKPHGLWKTLNKNGQIVAESNFSNGKLDGLQKQYETTLSEFQVNHSIKWNNALKYDTFPEGQFIYLFKEVNYINGKLSGKATTYNWQGKITSESSYTDGVISGKYYSSNALLSINAYYDNGMINGDFKIKLHYPKKDTVTILELKLKEGLPDGDAKNWHQNGELAYRASFSDGKPNGTSESFDPLGKQTGLLEYKDFLPSEEKVWEFGQPSATYLFDWTDSSMREDYKVESTISLSSIYNNLIYPYYKDPTSSQEAFLSKYLSDHKQLELNNYFGTQNKHGLKLNYYLTKYFPNGNVSREGSIISYKQSGAWKFYNYDGIKMYELNYFDSTFTLHDTLKFYTSGILYDFDENGKLTSSSFIIERSGKYDCANNDFYEIRQFYTTWQAHDSIGRINGFVQNRYDNGTLQSEGKMENGLPAGIWKFYDPMGKLNEVGEYLSGKRHGRWLKGDLEKIKYLGEICLNPNLPNLEEQIKYEEKVIGISIYYFNLGTQRDVQHYGLDLNQDKVNKYYTGRNYNSDIQLR